MKRSEPLVSVIVPVYNVVDYVAKCLDSLVRQTYKNIEIVVVDDGSTDGSGEICKEYAKKHSAIQVIRQKNGGLSAARNTGIRKARGDFLCFVDSDDFVALDYVEKLVDAVRDGAEIAVCGFSGEAPKKAMLSGRDAAKQLLIRQENIDIVVWNKIYKKTLFTDSGIVFPEGKKYEDSLTTYKILSLARKIAYIPNVLYTYVERSGSIMQSGKVEDRLRTREQAAREAMEFFAADAELAEAAKVSLLLAKYAFLDAAIRGEIDARYGREATEWIKKHTKEYHGMKVMTWKLRLYNSLVSVGLYRAFRKIV